MKAITYAQYGSPDMLRLTEVPKPALKDDHVLVKIHAVAVNSADDRLLRGEPRVMRLMFGLFKPRNTILGSDIAGRIEAIGRGVTQFRVGDEVYGELSSSGMGGFAEYVAAPVGVLAHKPERLSFAEAAAVPMAGIAALQALRDQARVCAGDHVLIYGASGGVGTFAVQIAKALGARVTAVTSARKLMQACELGADDALDYTRADFALSDAQYDVIIGVNGYRPIAEYRRALRPRGRYVMVGGSEAQIFQALILGALMSRGGIRLSSLLAKPNSADLDALRKLIDAGSVRPVIDRCYRLSETADAVRYLAGGHASGKVVITVKQEAAVP